MGNIAVIPARSGSKGLHDKNIIDFNGKPLMYYTIRAALEAHCFDEVMVSTDSPKYAEIAKQCGAKVPFLRSKETSSDTSGSWDVVREVLLNYKKRRKSFDYVGLLQPTSPLRDAKEIVGVFEQLKDMKANNAVTVTEVDHPIQWCFKLSKNRMMDQMADSMYSNTRRQELEVHYRENGALYVVDAKKIINPEYNFYADKCVGCVMSREKSIDIDSKMDLMLAKMIMSYQ